MIHTTVYFVNPQLICHGGRTAEEFAQCGTGDRVWLQLGTEKHLALRNISRDNSLYRKVKSRYQVGRSYFFVWKPFFDLHTSITIQVFID